MLTRCTPTFKQFTDDIFLFIHRGQRGLTEHAIKILQRIDGQAYEEKSHPGYCDPVPHTEAAGLSPEQARHVLSVFTYHTVT